ncbi:hypothetical protein [Cupriavidus oxalaticus]|uniref:hypothetical protein n=1 Tax=Cupriavidus oxalaticus TaxID=96344 RepID=UPI003177A81B
MTPSLLQKRGLGTRTDRAISLPMTQFGQGIGKKVMAGAYNAGHAGTVAFGTSSIFSATQNPGLAAGLSGGASAISAGYVALVPGPAGVFMNQLMQVAPGPLKTAIEKNQAKK